MLRIDEATISAIRKKHQSKEIVERYEDLTKKGEDYWCLCPFHNDSNASMCISTKLDMFQCFSCKAAGNIFNFISRKENISYGEAINRLAEEDGIIVANLKKENPHQKDYEILSLAIKFYQNNINSSLGESAIKYLEERKIDRDTIKKFEIGLSISKQPLTNFLLNKYSLNNLVDLGLTNTDSKDIFNDRIMIPIHDMHGNPIGFGGRIYRSKDTSKYINTKATRIFDKSNILYNYHRAHTKLEKNSSIIIMEGYFDVIRASTVGVNNCVAPMGTALTKQHISMLKKITNKIILCFDGDNAGEEATKRAIPLLEESNMDIKIVRLEEKDPDEFIIKRGREAFLEKINNPINVIDFRMMLLGKEKNLNDIADASSYLDEMLKSLAGEKDEILIELTIKKLANQFNIEPSTLKKRYKEWTSKSKSKNKPVTKEYKKQEKIPDKYGQATNNLLYYMIVSSEVTEQCEKSVSMIIDDKKRRLFNEIIHYYNKYGELEIADFITYIETKTDISDTLKEIITLNLKKDYTKEEITDYIQCVNDYYQKNTIEMLKYEMFNKETDPMKQAKKLKEIMKKRGVRTSD